MAAAAKAPPDAKAAFALLLVLAGIGAILDVGFLGWILTPICVLLGAFAIFRSPLRNTMLVLMFFAFTLENPAEIPAYDEWRSPFFVIGALLLTHWKTVVGGFWFFGGMDLMLATAGLTWYLKVRRQAPGIGTPRPMIRLAQLCYATIVFTWLVGKYHGGGDGGIALWQIDRVMYLPAVFLLCQAAFTGPKDYIAVGKVILAGAFLRSLQSMYVRAVVPAEIDKVTGESTLPYTTTHHDSMLFGAAILIVVTMIMQRVPKATRLAMWLVPVVIGGMICNDRRLAYVQLILVFGALYLVTEQNAIKRKLQKLALLLVPVGLGYVAAGWNSAGGGIFKPVKILRSALDSSTDESTAWRDLENFNLIFTIKQRPIVGTGYGHGFYEMWPMPQVAYPLERFIPHNSILGLWCYGGYVGFTGLTLLWVCGVYFAMRAYHHSKEPLEKAAALTAFGATLIYYVQCFGDLGLGTFTGVFLIAPALAIACKLAVKSGGWPVTPARAA